jgi:hypothetical protein
MTVCLIVSFLFILLGLLGTFSSEGIHVTAGMIMLAAGFVMLTILVCVEKLLKEIKKLGQISQGRPELPMHEAVARQEQDFRQDMES